MVIFDVYNKNYIYLYLYCFRYINAYSTVWGRSDSEGDVIIALQIMGKLLKASEPESPHTVCFVILHTAEAMLPNKVKHGFEQKNKSLFCVAKRYNTL